MSVSQLWYVRATFGALLGPMPVDTLKKMARTGDLIPEDFVRHGLEGEWIKASVLTELFETEWIRSTDEVEVSAQKEVETQQDQFVAATGLNAVATEPIAVECEPSLTAETESSLQTNPEQALPFLSPSPASLNPITEQSPKLGRTRGRRSAQVSVTTQSKFSLTQLHSSRTMTIVLLCVIVVAWWSWSRTDRDVCDRLFAIRTELIEHRVDPDKKNDLGTFASQALSELDAQIPSLERKASWGNQEANYLLLASRDCLKPMLQDVSRPHEHLEVKLDYFLWALRSYYEGQPLGAPKPPKMPES